MKTFSICLIGVLLAHLAIAVEPVGDADFKAGYSVGKSDGEEWASLGQNMPLPIGLDLIANGKSSRLDQNINRESWKLGYKAGYQNGFEGAKRTWKTRNGQCRQVRSAFVLGRLRSWVPIESAGRR